MRESLIGLAGLSAVAAGAFIRSCNDGARDLASAVCGAPAVSGAQHVHCAGCVSMAVGVVLLAASLCLMLVRAPRLAPAKAAR